MTELLFIQRNVLYMKRLPELFTLLASFFWGTSFIAVKLGLASMDPLWFLFIRMLIAALLLLPFLLRRIRWLDYLGHPSVWVAALFCALGYLFQYVGMVHTTASAAAFLVNLGIVFVALFSRILLKEPFDSVKIIGIGVAIFGATLLTGGFHPGDFSAAALQGNALMLASGLAWAAYTIGNKYALGQPGIHAVPLTALVLSLTSIIVLPAAVFWGQVSTGFSRNSWLIIAYMSVFSTVLPFVFWTRGLQGITPTVSAAILLMEPVFAAVLAYMILQERFMPIELCGAVLIFIAIAMVSFGKTLLIYLQKLFDFMVKN